MNNNITAYLKEIFTKLNGSNFRYAVLRGYETLPFEVSHDIDFGVHFDDLNSMINELENISHQFGYKLVYKSERMGFSQLYFYREGHCLKLDFWSEFSYKGLKYLEMHSVLQQTKIHNGIKVLNEEAEVLVSFLKEFLHNSWIRKDKIEILKEKLSKYSFMSIESLYLSNKNMIDFSSYILQSKTELKIEAKGFKKELFFRNIRINGFFKLISNLLVYIYKFLKDALKKKGVFVVLIGPDGSGKTTIAKMLINEVKEKTSCYTSSYYLHGRFGFIPNLAYLLGKEKEENNIMKFGVVQTQALKPHGLFRITLYMLYYSIDFALGYFKLLQLKFSHKIIVADRYFYDYFYQEHFHKYPKVLYNIYMKLLPTPDIVVFLKGDIHAIRKRKPELSIDRINIQQKNIQKLLADIENGVTVDSSQELTKTYNEIKNYINLKKLK